MFLADEGIKALIIEQENVTRYHIGESMTGAGGRVLRDLGLENEMYLRKFPCKQGVKVYGQNKNCTWCFPVTGRDENWNMFACDTWQVCRGVFDKLMLDEAVSRGADLIRGKALTPIISDDGAVSGVTVRLR